MRGVASPWPDSDQMHALVAGHDVLSAAAPPQGGAVRRYTGISAASSIAGDSLVPRGRPLEGRTLHGPQRRGPYAVISRGGPPGVIYARWKDRRTGHAL